MEPERLNLETSTIWATAVCFVLGAAAGALLLGNASRPLVGADGVAFPIAAIAGLIAAAAFAVSALWHRRGETARMPRWQAVISDLSAVALTIALGGVTVMGALLATEVFAVGLQGLQLAAVGSALLAGTAAAIGGRFAFGAGVGLRTADLAGILFGFLVIGTLFAMVTAADPLWWEANFSQLGNGASAWAFNGTLVVAGLLASTIGAYIGRDLHRMLGDAALGRIAWCVVLWAATGVTLAAVGLLPLYRAQIPHRIAAYATLGLFVAAAVCTTVVVSKVPRALLTATVGVGVLLLVAIVLWEPFHVFSTTALEAIVIGLGLLWMTTLVRVLAILAPSTSRPSERESLLNR